MSADQEQEVTSADPPEVTLRGMITPRTQIILIAVAIALFNALLIGFLAWLIFLH